MIIESSFQVQIPVLENGILPDRFGIKNRSRLLENVPTLSFPLSWQNQPAGTVCFCLVFEDFDNVEDEGVSWLHWLVANIPAELCGLAEDESRTNPNLIQGRNSWALPYGPYEGISKDVICHYGGPAPGRPHEYECTLFALDCILNLKNGFYYNQLRNAMEGHVLGKGILKMRYNPN